MRRGKFLLNSHEIYNLNVFTTQIRKETLKCIASIGIGHIGGSLSIAELLAVLYGKVMHYDPQNPKLKDRDYFVLSKGHSGPALYSTLALKKFFPIELLGTLNKPKTALPSHCDMCKTTGIDMSTGSLGQGSSAACGIALGNKLNKLNNFTYVVFGDGELQEGQIWESALFAAHNKLSHLIAFVDYNGLQIDGTTDQICSLGNLEKKFEAFDWQVKTVDGHNVNEIYNAIIAAQNCSNAPSMIILKTKKGRGVSLFEDKVSCHNAEISADILKQGLKELDAYQNSLEGNA